MTVRKDSQRYKRNVGGCRYLQENKDRVIKHVLRQFRYIKFLDNRWKEKCQLKRKPYPKYYNENQDDSKDIIGGAFKKYGKTRN